MHLRVPFCLPLGHVHMHNSSECVSLFASCVLLDDRRVHLDETRMHVCAQHACAHCISTCTAKHLKVHPNKDLYVDYASLRLRLFIRLRLCAYVRASLYLGTPAKYTSVCEIVLRNNLPQKGGEVGSPH